MATDPDDPPYRALARAIDSGALGSALVDKLNAEFPDISRHDVFMGIALAWTLKQADLIVAEGEAMRRRRR